jgi:hypothetical protein
MRFDVEVRSSGPGPRKVMTATDPTVLRICALSAWMGWKWTREGLDYKGRWKRLADGVAIIIRRAT